MAKDNARCGSEDLSVVGLSKRCKELWGRWLSCWPAPIWVTWPRPSPSWSAMTNSASRAPSMSSDKCSHSSSPENKVKCLSLSYYQICFSSMEVTVSDSRIKVAPNHMWCGTHSACCGAVQWSCCICAQEEVRALLVFLLRNAKQRLA